MAEPLKNSFGPDVVTQIAATLPVGPGFERDCLVGFDELGLMDRARHIAEVMHRHLDPDPATAIRQVHASLGNERLPGMQSFFYNPHAMFIGAYGLPAFEESMAAMYDLTKLFTAEFCIRPFINEHPETMPRLRVWATDPDEHVRRLVSEGTRPRLPWAAQLPAFRTDPEPVIELLELLKDDSSDYVRRSVGNNLNDISKDHPARALEVAARWLPTREDLVRRGLRTLIKAGDPQALALLGFKPAAVTATADLPSTVTIGQTLPIAVHLHGHGPVLADLVVHFVKANGSSTPKVFKGGEVDLDGQAVIRRSVSFAQLSTRTPYPGPHKIAVLLNGRSHDLGVVEVLAAPQSPTKGDSTHN
ncbi:MAG: DNA alkylation repair protein [Candidatus Nanopelagicales bacterium]|nr:DNA alkylation repair protein [Candidatus Nanopelagicales bacterium]